MRTMNKSKNKKGVVLVTILFILAIAMIFIASALLLTKATRGRIYVRAQDNQARLTVTSAAESFYQALFLQEIKDSDLQAMDGAVLEIVNPNMPGMESGHAIQSRFGENCPDDGQTIAEFEVGTNSAVINFKTNIGGQVECIQMGLQIKAPKTNKNNFPNVLEIGNGGSLNGLDVGNVIGGTSRYDAGRTASGVDKNTVVVHGDMTYNSAGTTNIYSTYINTGHSSIRDTNFYGDVVFWGDESGYDINSGFSNGTPMKMDGSTGNVFFIESDSSFYNNNAHLTSTNTSGIREDITTGNRSWVFKNVSNSYWHSEQMFQSIGTIYTDNSTLSPRDYNQTVPKLNDKNAGAPTGTLLTTLNSYAATNFAAGGDSPSEYTWNSINSSGWGGTGSLTSHRTGMNALSSKLTGDVTNLTPGSYSLTGTLTNKIVNVDLAAGDYYFFIDSSFTFGAGGAIVAKNGTANNYACYIVIGSGAYMAFNGGNSHHGLISANVYKNVTFDDTQNELKECFNKSNINQSVSPYIYVYSAGSGGNTGLHNGGTNCDSGQIRICDNDKTAILTAYVGMYPSSYNATTGKFSDDAGAFSVAQNVDSVTIYGRISASCVAIKNANEHVVQVPYCPEPNTDGLSDKPVPQYTDYRIYDYQYYTM